MQDTFETALAYTYIPKLIPGVKEIVFSNDVAGFEWVDRQIKYPSALVVRNDLATEFVLRYPMYFQDTHNAAEVYPADITYTIKAYVEKQVEMIALRDHMRVAFQTDPYVRFQWMDDPYFPIGLRFVKISTTDERSNYDERGAARVVDLTFQCRVLIIGARDDIPEIEEIRMQMNGYAEKIKNSHTNVVVDYH